MTTPLNEFLTDATQKAMISLVEAYLRLPEDKRNWSPMGTARTAADMLAECAVMNDVSGLIRERKIPDDFDYAEFQRTKAALTHDWEALQALLRQNTSRGIASIQTVSAEDLKDEIAMPFGTFTLAQIISYPYWNMSYHEGQINYIASMLEDK